MRVYEAWHVIGTWDFQAVGAMAMVVVVGTVLSFSFYMEGVRIIGATRASLFASVEPVTATAATVLIMHTAFTLPDFFWNSLYYGSGSDTVN